MDTKELEVPNLFYYSPIDENGGMLGPPFSVVHNHLLFDHVEREVVILAPHCQVFDLLPIGCLIVISDHCCVVCKLNDGVGVVLGHAVMGEQGVQEGTEHAPLRGPCVEDHHGSVARLEVQDPVAKEGVSPRVLSLVMNFEGNWVLNTEL